jgi:lactoylglutathione lyase
MASIVQNSAKALAGRVPHNFSWQQTMLRIKDPKVTVPFYVNHFGFQLLHSYDFPQWKFSLYFLAILPEGVTAPSPGTPEAEEFLWNFSGVALELTHNHGSEDDASFKVNNGNVEPHRGFGHLAVMTRDVYAVSTELEANGVKFQKRPDEGRMKGLAFALDPDGYWIEIIRRDADSPVHNKYTLAQTMLRVKDNTKSLHFYRDLLGMTLLSESVVGAGTDWGFTLYFLAYLSEEQKVELAATSAGELMRKHFFPVIELTYNHGTESKTDFKYHNGNDNEAGQGQGFGHTGFLVDDLGAACSFLEENGVAFKKKPEEGGMREIAFVYDPDNYWVEIIQRDGFKVTRNAALASAAK